jgi:DMSO/TMAO reductase YedYZ molybdopterin-dependent catalytic subunit
MTNSLPPGQQLAAPGKWPAVGERAPGPGPDIWTLTLGNPSGAQQSWTLDELRLIPNVRRGVDIHCVTRWSKPGMEFTGVRLQDVLDLAMIDISANFISFVARSERAHSTSLPLKVALQQETLLAWEANGAPLESTHGGPLRVIVPGRYFYKSLKWLERMELLAEDRLGFWEATAGYHNEADPWREQRYLASSLDRREAARLLANRDFASQDLRGIDARGHDLTDVNARDSLLRDADFRGCQLARACFDGANLSNARLAGANLAGASFVNADLEGADFSAADLRGANLTGASIFGATFAPIDAEGKIDLSQKARWDATTRFDTARLEDLLPGQREALFPDTRARD